MSSSADERWCVVTGGRGFAARHLVEMLIKFDMFLVRIADLESAIRLSPEEENGILGNALKSGSAKYVSMDLCDKSQVLKAIEGAEVVFHMAAPNSSINNYQLHYAVNVQGTKNVIDACVELNVKRLIYTSSASVVFDGINGILDGDETLPYAAKPLDSYSATKAEGEIAILKANGNNGLLTCSLRPSSIFGPGDRLFVPSLAAAAKAGKSKFIIGDGNNVYDFTYVENVAHSHICAERALASGGKVAEQAAGQAYFITNMEPIKFWEFVSLIVGGLGYERPRIKVPALAVMPIAHLVEQIYKLLGPYGMKVPQLIPSRIRLLSCSRSFNCSKAKDRLGYTPIISFEEGLKRTLDSYSHLRAENQPKREGPSKAHKCLGGGRVADTLLWKNKKQTLCALLIMMTIYYYLVASQSTIMTALAKLLIAAVVFLFVHANLPEKIFGYTIEKLPASYFHLTEEKSHQAAHSVASSWNAAVNVLKSLCRGNDWILFLKVALLLLILSFLGAISLQSIFVIGLPVAFVAFLAYETHEETIDAKFSELVSFGCRFKSDLSKKVIGAEKDK
ncbi:3beta-hydroxysteroid-dehydrogenase/decarboxylase [Mercurialis annua]|uniref:3beta-hydroxysteroid- dehydrogenase/decarboxylase n=1 Tax=Mercurialis annua TaxID=3986 RepID=UPI00215DF6A9|nr:3beta-hydroxysteroid-dehydrogenase/decarboxylase [Mercurialis annua]XP_050219185.1 3beta-hydroxysteroid-dehydrogenase/decarboxylase [Mercurialis annua]